MLEKDSFQHPLKPSSWIERSESYNCSDTNEIFAIHWIWKTSKIYRFEFQIGVDVINDENKNGCYCEEEKGKGGFSGWCCRVQHDSFYMSHMIWLISLKSAENLFQGTEGQGKRCFSKEEVWGSWEIVLWSYWIEYGIDATLDKSSQMPKCNGKVRRGHLRFWFSTLD